MLSITKAWSSLTKEKKEYYLSEYFSHEFNYFLKKRDPAFFESTVRHFLTCKMEKTFMDLYLLDEDA
jgi:hypothetical protein